MSSRITKRPAPKTPQIHRAERERVTSKRTLRRSYRAMGARLELERIYKLMEEEADDFLDEWNRGRY